MIQSAARSLTDWPGFMNSALPRISQPVSSDARRSRISGVLPTATGRSRAIFIGQSPSPPSRARLIRSAAAHQPAARRGRSRRAACRRPGPLPGPRRKGVSDRVNGDWRVSAFHINRHTTRCISMIRGTRDSAAIPGARPAGPRSSRSSHSSEISSGPLLTSPVAHELQRRPRAAARACGCPRPPPQGRARPPAPSRSASPT